MRKTVNEVIRYLARERKPSLSYPFIAGESGIKEQRLKNLAREKGAPEGRRHELNILLEKFHHWLPLHLPAWKWAKVIVDDLTEKNKPAPTGNMAAEMLEQIEILESRVRTLQDRVRELEDEKRELVKNWAKKNLTVRIN